MARYYKYKSADDLISDARELGAELSVAAPSTLLEPLMIGSRTVGNRLCIQPMEGCDGTLDGQPDELTFRRYRRFGAGGAKLIWGEATAIDEAARMNPRQLWLHPGSAAALEQMLADCRKSHREVCGSTDDLLLGLQLTHSGRFSYRRPQLVTHDALLDPLTIDKSTGRRVDDSFPLLTDSDLQRIEDQYVDAARLAAKIGCDFIDLKQCHRYLLSELLAAKNRPGSYGGSLENRTRLMRNLITRIRSDVPGLMLVSRMNVYDGIPYARRDRLEPGCGDATGVPVPHQPPIDTGFGVAANDHLQVDLEEPLQVVRWLREWGIAALNVSMGNPYANPHVVRPAEFPPVDGYECPEHPLRGVIRHLQATAAIQQTIPDVPVVGSGYSWLQDFAFHVGAAQVQAGHCAFVGLGRGALSHPEFARAIQETGHLDRKRVCRTFSYCTNLMRNKNHPLGQYPTGCPPFDKDVYGPLWKEIEPRSSSAPPPERPAT